jgi:ABC-type branched-subunit amino acid transport system ATPase component/ABC-type branched-subunit amino acid transport system permease subunit
MSMTTINKTKYGPLVIALVGLLISPLIMRVLGLTPGTATDVVIFAIAALGLNLLVGHTGLTSFGHGAFFGIGAYAAALSQKFWFEGQLILPLLFTVLFSMALAWCVGALILRRRGVYFSLLTLAFSALTFAIAFRWTALTGGENGIGNVVRPAMGVLQLDQPVNYLIAVSVVGWLVLYLVWRLLRSPFGHVMAAIRENEQRAQFQGYDTQRCKLLVFVISGTLTGLAGGLLAFHYRFASADPTSVAFSGELLAVVVIGGMHSLLGPVLGAFFYILFREFLSIWTPNWLFYFGLMFVSFIMFSPKGLIGVWGQIRRRLSQAAQTGAAMSARKIYEGLPFPSFLQPDTREGTALTVKHIAKRFGGVHAVRDCSLTLQAGIHALIGPNGSGKTTTFNLISGMFRPDQGEILLYGKPLTGKSASQISNLGLARSFQITNLFKGLSIYENLRLSVQARHPGHFNIWRSVETYEIVDAQTVELVKYLGLEGIEHSDAASLSYGGQRLVDMGIALGCHPKVLLLDEPLAGLAAAERERISHLIQTIQHHIPVLIVEHDLDRVLGFSQNVTVMNDGNVLMSGTPDAVRADESVQAVYTGTGTPIVQGRLAKSETRDEVTLLSFEQVNSFYGKSHILNNATLDVRQGEIVALLGRNGAGKSTLLKALTGLVRPSSGKITFDSKEIAGLSAPDIARIGIGYVPQGRGLFAGMSVRDNLALGRMNRLNPAVGGTYWTEDMIFEYFPRLKERMDVAADYLSGGEQQMVAVARALSGNIKLLLLDEPFEGLAPAVVNELFTVFDRLRSQVSILIVEHNLDLVLALADRVFALEHGQVFHSGPADALLDDLDYRKKILWM